MFVLYVEFAHSLTTVLVVSIMCFCSAAWAILHATGRVLNIWSTQTLPGHSLVSPAHG
jgi:hypothetical protein